MHTPTPYLPRPRPRQGSLNLECLSASLSSLDGKCSQRPRTRAHRAHIIVVKPTHRAGPKSRFWWESICCLSRPVPSRPLSNLTPPQGIFLLLDAAALGFAAAVLHLRYTPAPLYGSGDVVTSVLLPVVTAAVDGLWVAALCVFHRVSHHGSRF